MITALTDSQLQGALDACIRRCCNGNHFAPDLAEFMGIVSCEVNNPFGLTVGDVMNEFKRYNSEKYKFSCAETFKWKQPVLYHICCILRSEMLQRSLGDSELEKRAAVHLKAWSDKVLAGGSVPEPRPLLSEKPGNRKAWDGGAGHQQAMAILAKLRGGKPQTN